MPNLKAKEYRQFENIKYVRQDGSEYWSARELADVLDYSQWTFLSTPVKPNPL